MFEFNLCLHNRRIRTIYKNLSGAIEYRDTKYRDTKYRSLMRLRKKLNDNNISDIIRDKYIDTDLVDEYFIIRKPGRSQEIEYFNTIRYYSSASARTLISKYSNDKEFILTLLNNRYSVSHCEQGYADYVYRAISSELLEEDIEINLAIFRLDRFGCRQYKDLPPKIRNSKRIARLFIGTVEKEVINQLSYASERVRDDYSICVQAIKNGYSRIYELSDRLRRDPNIIKLAIYQHGRSVILNQNVLDILNSDIKLRLDVVIFAVRSGYIEIKDISHTIVDKFDDELIASLLDIDFSFYKHIELLSTESGRLDADAGVLVRIINLMKISNKTAKQMFELMDTFYTHNVGVVAAIIRKNIKAYKYIPYDSYLRKHEQIISLIN